jgi:probable HAF family extracellular repeat protein
MRATSKFKLLLMAVIAGPLACLAQTYSVTDLGTLKHGSARVHAINSNAQAAGASGFPHGADTHAFFWQKQGGMRDLGTLGGDFSAAYALNDSGQVVGSSNTADTVHAFLWTSAAGLSDLGTLSGDNASQAYAINNAAQIVGTSGTHAALWNNGTVQDLGNLGGPTAEAHGINNNGQIVGFSDTPSDGPRAFIFSNGAMQRIDPLSGDVSSRADHINDSGMVVGASFGSSGVHAFVWTSASGIQPIPPLNGSDYSEAFAINNVGQVVGQSGSSLGTRAFLWTSSGGTIDLNEAVPHLPGDTVLTGAFAINDKGQIVAFGVKNPNVNRHEQVTIDSHLHSGPVRVFLLTPQ